jgi:hypothetical protein
VNVVGGIHQVLTFLRYLAIESIFVRDGISSQYSVEVDSFTNASLPSFAARLRRYAYPNLSHRKAFASLAEIAEKLAPALVIESASRKFAPATGIHKPRRGIIY